MSEQVKLAGAGFTVGVFSGLLGIGGGIFLVPIMVAYFRITQHVAQATSMAIIIPTALISSVVYGFHGNTDMKLAMYVVVGSMLGAGIGARLMNRIPAIRLKQLFAVLLIFSGLRMVCS